MRPTSSTIRIRRARLGDLDKLVALFRGYLEFYRQPASVRRIRSFLSQRLRRRQSVIFLATLDGAAVGFVQLYPTFASLALGRAWILYDLFVAPQARRYGV